MKFHIDPRLIQYIEKYISSICYSPVQFLKTVFENLSFRCTVRIYVILAFFMRTFFQNVELKARNRTRATVSETKITLIFQKWF